MTHQKIFKDAVVDRLYMGIRNGDSIDQYREEHIEINPNEILETSIIVSDTFPELGTKPADDVESAISLFEYLGPLNATQASDRRLWTYLSHVTFREYTMKRWEVEPDNKKASTSILEHWFVSENDRRLRRHSLARLWWAANLTVSPWVSDPVNFVSLRNEDSYAYTRILLSTQDIFQQVLERSMGRSRKILIALLESFRTNTGVAQDRDAVRNVIKETNLVSGYKKLTYLPYDEVFGIINSLALEQG